MDTARDAFKYLWTSSGRCFVCSCVATCSVTLGWSFGLWFLLMMSLFPTSWQGFVCDRRLLVLREGGDVCGDLVVLW